jgi:DNA-binding MarR family transcriptional regulator
VTEVSVVALSPAAQVIVALLRAQQAVNAKLDEQLRHQIGIAHSHFDVLRAVAAADDEQLRMADIADAMCCSRSGVTQSIDRLEQLGLVDRVTHPDDRRIVLASLTDAGRTLVQRGRQVLESVATHFVAETLSPAETTAVAIALAKMSGAGLTDSEAHLVHQK